MKRALLRWGAPLVIIILAIAMAAYVVATNAEAREVATESAFLLFTVFTTPFVLEVSVALFGLAAVITYNQWRLSKEGDEWVEIEVSEVKSGEEQK